MTATVPCGVRHIRLDIEPVPLAPEAGEKAVLVFFWWRGLPLGRRLFTAGELPMPASAVLSIGTDAAADAVSAWLSEIPDDPRRALNDLVCSHSPARWGSPTLSVVVCTRDRPDALSRCLASILACDPAPDEIVVVDNAPSTAKARAVCERLPQVRYVLEPRPGLSHARNTGVTAANAEIVAFTDDDVEVATNWVAGLRAGFGDPRVASVTGPVLPKSLMSEAAFAFEFDYGGLAGGLTPKLYDPTFLRQPLGEAPPVWRIGAGANMAMRKCVVGAVGGFDPRLGAGASGCSEDSELWHRLLLEGHSCLYSPAAVVHHDHRSDLPALRSQMRCYMRGHIVALLVQFGSSRDSGNLIRAFLGLPVWMAALTAFHVVRRRSIRRAILPWEIVGLLEGPISWARWTSATRSGRR